MSINTNIASTLAGGKKLHIGAEVGGTVEVAVSDGFHDVVVEDVGGAFEVGDGAGDFEDAVVGSRAHVHALHGVLQLLQAGGVGLGVFVQQGRGHLGVAVDAGFVLEAALLQHPGGDDALANGGTGFARGLAGHLPTASVGCASAMLKRVWHCARLAQQLVEIDGLDLDLQVDAVEQRARNLAHIMRALVLVADALLRGVPIVPARAWIHRGHEHERRGVFGRILGSANGNHPVLQRLPHHLKHTSIEFRQFIQA